MGENGGETSISPILYDIFFIQQTEKHTHAHAHTHTYMLIEYK